MHKWIQIALLLLPMLGMAQKDSIPPMPAYDTVFIHGGFDVDKYCTLERRRAVHDIQANRLYYIDPVLNAPRYAPYMAQLCHNYKITYYLLPEATIGLEGFNPMRCYMAFMDSAIKQKFGANIKTTLPARADSLYLANLSTDTVEEKYCTKPAYPVDTAIYHSHLGEIIRAHCSEALYRKFKNLTTEVSEPIMLINLLILPSGRVGGYSLISFESDNAIFYNDTLKTGHVYTGCGKDFWQLALAGIKNYPMWQPAQVDGRNVTSWHRVEVVFDVPKQSDKSQVLRNK